MAILDYKSYNFLYLMLITIFCKNVLIPNFITIENINLKTKCREIIYDRNFTTLTLWGFYFPLFNQNFFLINLGE